MDTNYNKLMNNLDELNLPKYLQMIAEDQKDIVSALYELTELEKTLRVERAIKACVNTASFPFQKTLDDYDFSFQPVINKAEIEDFRTLRFIESNENILFIGTPDVGKTHLATAIEIEATTHRYSVHFISCQALMEQLKKAEQENRLAQRLKTYTRYKLLIIDEIGYLNLDTQSANLFFQLISLRYENKSTIITTNKNLSKWGEVFGNPVIANAILDRLLHHSHIVNIVGPSYRTKDVLSALED